MLVEPIRAADKTGAALKDTSIYDYKHAFRLNVMYIIINIIAIIVQFIF